MKPDLRHTGAQFPSMVVSVRRILEDRGGWEQDGEQRQIQREQQHEILVSNLHIKITVVRIGYVAEEANLVPSPNRRMGLQR